MKMNNDQFTIEEQTLITRLSHAPQADLPAEAFENIRQQLWEEVDKLSSPTPNEASSTLSVKWIVLAIVAILIAMIIGIFVLQALSEDENDLATAIQTIVPSETVPNADTEATEDADTSITDMPIEVTEDVSAASPTAQASDLSETAHIIIEGSIQSMGIDSIQIFDTEIQVDPANPILMEIRIGDTIRVEGDISIEDNLIMIVAINITVINSTIIEVQSPTTNQPTGGGGLPSNCRRTPKGKVTCRGRSSRRR